MVYKVVGYVMSVVKLYTAEELLVAMGEGETGG